MYVVVKGSIEPHALAPMIRQALERINPALPPYAVRALDDIRAEQLRDRRFARAALTTFGGFAAALASVGLFGLLMYVVGLRAREIAIRMALGASPSRLRRQVVGTSLRLASGGIVLGIGTAAVLSRVVAARVPGLGRIDGGTMAIAAASTLFVALVATWLPSRRAWLVDPLVLLRGE